MLRAPAASRIASELSYREFDIISVHPGGPLSQGTPYSPSARRFLTAVTVLALVTVGAMVYAGFWIRGNQGVTKAVGWTAVIKAQSWFVGAVQPGGPASGRLIPGDRILSIDGDKNAARIGPSWFF